MQIILASAKIMRDSCGYPGISLSEPKFMVQASALARDLSHRTGEELSELFACSPAIGEQNRQRFSVFGTDEAERMPAILAYHGQAYKHLRADEFPLNDLQWANSHLMISSCLYGLLRPFDGINLYRMEGGFVLPCTYGKKVNEFWKDMLTEALVQAVKADDGVLIYLDTEEFRCLFDWKAVLSETQVVEPKFHVIKNGRLTTPSVWAKTCRGAMTRFIIENRITDTEGLKNFSYKGFAYDEEHSTEGFPCFIRK